MQYRKDTEKRIVRFSHVAFDKTSVKKRPQFFFKLKSFQCCTSQMPPVKCSKEQSDQFWKKRPWVIIQREDGTDENIASMKADDERREGRHEESYKNFELKHSSRSSSPSAESFKGEQERNDVSFWMIHSSWTTCEKCQSLQPCKLFPRLTKRPLVKPVKDCGYSSNRYIIPNLEDIPLVLRQLTFEQIVALRPLDVHTGDYEMHKHGYRKKGGMFRPSWSEKSVDEKIAALPNVSRVKCQAALDFLMASTESTYADLIEKRQLSLANDKHFNMYESSHRQFVECCLWLHLQYQSNVS